MPTAERPRPPLPAAAGGRAARPGRRRRRRRAGPRSSGAPRASAGSRPTTRCGGCTPTPRCSPAGWPALLLQSLHPLAMAGVAGHSGYKGDPWGRLQRTSHFLATTTFGTVEDAEAAIARVRGIHERVRGHDPTGGRTGPATRTCSRWVHVAEAHSFLTAYQRYAVEPLTASRGRHLRRAVGAGRRPARGHRPADDGRRARRGPDGLPARARGDRRGPRGRAVPAARPAAALGGPARATG